MRQSAWNCAGRKMASAPNPQVMSKNGVSISFSGLFGLADMFTVSLIYGAVSEAMIISPTRWTLPFRLSPGSQ